MDAIIFMLVGAGIVVGLLVMKYGAAKVWAYVQTWLKQRAGVAEKAFAEKVHGVIHERLSKVEGDIAAVKTKVGM